MHWLDWIEALLLTAALSVDAFAAGFGYGAQEIRIPPLSALLLSGGSSLMLGLSLWAGSWLGPLLPPGDASLLSGGLLLFLAALKLCDSSIKAALRRLRPAGREFTFSALQLRFILRVYADPAVADQDHSQVLTAGEAGALAAALSLDGLAAGVGAALGQISPLPVVVLSFGMGLLAVTAGAHLGHRAAQAWGWDFSWISGMLLLLLAWSKLA